MENISKAVMIGGTTIITILVMALLWNLYTKFQTISKIDEETKVFEQDTEYNKRFLAYNRSDVKGIDILSLNNLVEDYNLREVANPEVSGINVTIKVKKGTSYIENNIKKYIQENYESKEEEEKAEFKQKEFKLEDIEYKNQIVSKMIFTTK